MKEVIFYILSFIILVSSVLSVTTNKILRAAVYLLFALVGTAAFYFMMNYDFLAAVQLTVYAGGIVVLIIFSILLTHQINTNLEKSSTIKKLSAAVVGVLGSTLVMHAARRSSSLLSSRERVGLSLLPTMQRRGCDWSIRFEGIGLLYLTRRGDIAANSSKKSFLYIFRKQDTRMQA